LILTKGVDTYDDGEADDDNTQYEEEKLLLSHDSLVVVLKSFL
jgi:hypothetical protein